MFVMATGCRSAGGGDSLQVNVLASSLQTEFKGEVIEGGGGQTRSVCLPINMSVAAPVTTSEESPHLENF